MYDAPLLLYQIFLNMSDNSVCDHSSCSAATANKSVCQTLSEMDWERGIWYAASTNDKEKVQSIISKSANPRAAVNECDNSGYTALHFAARNGHLEICKLLIENGAHINAETNGKATPLHKAAVGGKLEAVKLLIHHGACVTQQDVDGQTAFHKAKQNNYIAVAAALLEVNPGLQDIKDSKGK